MYITKSHRVLSRFREEGEEGGGGEGGSVIRLKLPQFRNTGLPQFKDTSQIKEKIPKKKLPASELRDKQAKNISP